MSLEGADFAAVPQHAELWEAVVRKLRLGVMPPQGARRPDPRRARRAWPRRSKRDARRRGRRTSRSRPAGAASPEPRRVRQRRPRSAGSRRGRHGAVAARHGGVRLRQRGRRAGQLAGAAAGVSVGGAKNQRRRRRRPRAERRQPDLYRAPGPVAGAPARRHAARHRGRPARHAHVPARRRVRVPGADVAHQSERHPRPRVSPRGGAVARRRAAPARRRSAAATISSPCSAIRRPPPTRSRRSGCGCARASRRGSARSWPRCSTRRRPKLQAARLQPFIRDFDNPFGAERAPHVQSITVTGPVQRHWRRQSGEPPLFVCRPAAAAERGTVRAPHCRLARPPRLPPAARRHRDRGPARHLPPRAGHRQFDTGVEAVLRRILASPSFVFRPEAEPARCVAGVRVCA